MIQRYTEDVRHYRTTRCAASLLPGNGTGVHFRPDQTLCIKYPRVSGRTLSACIHVPETRTRGITQTKRYFTMDIIDMYYNVGQHKTKVLKTSSTVNQLLFACENFSRGSRNPHRCQYLSPQTSPQMSLVLYFLDYSIIH